LGVSAIMSYRISVDTGGTFTDVVVSDQSGHYTIGKSLTTPERIYEGMENALKVAAEELSISLKELLSNADILIYGTTRATNAIVTGKVANTAFITTAGFPDTLVVKEGGKFNPHDFSKEFPKPYIPRRHTFEIEGRIDSSGMEVIPFNYKKAKSVCLEVGDKEFEAIAVCFLWSIANPTHEQEMGELIQETLPGIPFTLSHKLIPVVREYRRSSATAIDASLKPLMQSHLKGLEVDLRGAGYSGEILVSNVSGGCSNIDTLIDKPIYTVNSGPAMAPIAGLEFSSIEGQGNDVIVCDSGGTTFDVGLVRAGRLAFSRDSWMGQPYTGHLLGVSSVDVRSIGAGGGSIAWIDEGGLMRVGPQSAGAKPGPACYGLGGKDPTVSDAAAVLGYFNPEFFLGGMMALDIASAYKVLEKVSNPIGIQVELAAWQILNLASDLMMGAISDITINEGFDPRDSTIVAGGGAAGLNILKIAEELGCQRVIIPKVASALSAAGMQFADIVCEESASLFTSSANFDFEGVNSLLDSLERKLTIFRHSMPVYNDSPFYMELTAEARYEGQVWELDTPITTGRLKNNRDLDAFIESFHKVHERVFAVRDEGSSVEVMSWKARLSLKVSSQSIIDNKNKKDSSKIMAGNRVCWFGYQEPMDTPVYRGSSLTVGKHIEGPAIIEEPTTTIVVYPDMAITVSENGNYLVVINN